VIISVTLNPAVDQTAWVDRSIRALTRLETSADRSIEKTNAALGVTGAFLPATTRPIPHLAGAEGAHD